MNIGTKRLSASIAILFALAPLSSFAWTNVSNAFQRLEIGASYPMCMGKYTHNDQATTFSGNYYDTTFSTNVSSKQSFGGFIGTYFPLKNMGERSSLNLAIGLEGNMFSWEYPSLTYSSLNNGVFSYVSNAKTSLKAMQIGLPISLDYKFGGQATLNRQNRLSLSIGLGVYTNAINTSTYSNLGWGIGVKPFIKAELGFFAGICFKLRTSLMLGSSDIYNINYVPVLSGGLKVNSNTQLTNAMQVNATLILMPFSFKWRGAGFWN